MKLTLEIPDELVADVITSFDPSGSNHKGIADADYIQQCVLSQIKARLVFSKGKVVLAQAKASIDTSFAAVAISASADVAVDAPVKP